LKVSGRQVSHDGKKLIERILIVGLGSIGKRHLRLVRELLPFAEIAVLRHKETPLIPEFADHIFSTMDQALAFAPQVAVIANPATLHLSAAMPLAKAGVHLLIEKPLSDSAAGVANLLHVSQQNKSLLAIGYNLRFLPALQKFKSLLCDNVIGTVWSIRSEFGQFLPSWRSGVDYRQGVSAQHILGGGVLLELSHEIDYLRWIFGEVDWVQASLTTQGDLEIDVEDSAHLMIGFCSKCGAKPIVATLNLDFIRQDTSRSCTAIGKLGSLRWNAIDGTVELWASGTQGWQEIYKHQATRDESYLAEWNNFLKSIEQGVPPMITGEDGLKVLHVIEAARLANKTKSQVHVVAEKESRGL
jgi:predicted dehydrogenase